MLLDILYTVMSGYSPPTHINPLDELLDISHINGTGYTYSYFCCYSIWILN